MSEAFLAIDWGTTNRRVFVIGGDNAVIRAERDDHGILTVAASGFADEVAAIRSKLGDLPVLAAGMVGSTRGWHETPYAPAPADIEALARAVYWIEPGRTAIVPGVSWREGMRGDVMRGEEVQFLGAVAAGLAPADALLCQPGTHCKWASMVGGRIERFVTSMTGEMFSMLKSHSLLAAQLAGAVEAGPAFFDGVADAVRGDLLAGLFSVRASSLLVLRADADAAAYTSGLLIGSDVRVRLSAGATHVYVLAGPALGTLYSAAIDHVGSTAHLVDSNDAFVAGITRIWELL